MIYKYGNAFKRFLKLSSSLVPSDAFVRRGIDIGFVLAAAIPASIVFGIAAIAVCRETGCPILFRQTRIGWRGKKFEMFKIRSLANLYDELGAELPENDRRTPVGEYMRSRTIDEIPQLWNILKGEMSLFGPRPLPDHYMIAHDLVRQSVRPGVVGLAQVLEKEAGEAPNLEFRLERDKKYIATRTLRMDVRLAMRAFLAVKKGNGDKANRAAIDARAAGALAGAKAPAERQLTPTS